MIDVKKIFRTIVGLFFIMSIPLIIFGFVMSQISKIDKTTGIWIFLGWTIFLLIGLFILPIRYTRNESEEISDEGKIPFQCNRCKDIFWSPQSLGGHRKWCNKKRRK